MLGKYLPLEWKEVENRLSSIDYYRIPYKMAAFSRKFHFTFVQTTSKPDCERYVRSKNENRTRKHIKGVKFRE